MSIAFPAMEKDNIKQPIFSHFGKSAYYLVLDDNGALDFSIKNTSEHFGGTKSPPELLKENGISTLVCVSLGPKAIELFQKLSVEVRIAPNGITIADAFLLLKENKLQGVKNEDACKDHAH